MPASLAQIVAADRHPQAAHLVQETPLDGVRTIGHPPLPTTSFPPPETAPAKTAARTSFRAVENPVPAPFRRLDLTTPLAAPTRGRFRFSGQPGPDQAKP